MNYSDPAGTCEWHAKSDIASQMQAKTMGCLKPAPTANPGAARPFRLLWGGNEWNTGLPPTNVNCYGYAIGEDINKDPGSISKSYFYDIHNRNVYEYAMSVEADMKALGRSIRRVSGPGAEVGPNEYKIALRVGPTDYHFMVQTWDGTWAEKHGASGRSQRHLNFIFTNDPSRPWKSGNNEYTSEILYFAIEQKK